MSRRLCVTGDEAEVATRQHKTPCGDCPWRRDALAGWLGSMSADEWVRSAHGEDVIECHTLAGAQCAGSGIYRGNICKQPRDKTTLRLPADRVKVFASPMEFKAYHEGDSK